MTLLMPLEMAESSDNELYTPRSSLQKDFKPSSPIPTVIPKESMGGFVDTESLKFSEDKSLTEVDAFEPLLIAHKVPDD